MAGKQQDTALKLDTIERIILYVRDTRRATKFYTKTLGLPVRVQEDGWVEFETKGTTLCLHSGRDRRPAEGETSLSFQVRDFDAAYRQLQLLEVDGLTDPRSPCEGTRYVSFKDPDGNALSIEGK